MSIVNRIVYGGPDADDYLQGAQSLGEYCVRSLTQFADKIILIDAATDTQLSAIALRDHGIRHAECLRSLGIRSGDTVAICTDNQLEFVYLMLGTHILGACLTPLNPSYTEREFQHAIQLARPKWVFCEQANAKSFAAIRKQCRFLEGLVVFDRVEPVKLPRGARKYSAFVRNPKVRQVADGGSYVCEPQKMAERVSLVLYSSGTTGQPKGVQLSQQNSLIALHRHNRRRDAAESDIPLKTSLSVVPFFHTFGVHVALSCIFFGDCLVFLPRFEPHAFLGAIQRYRCTNLYVAPPLMVFLAKSPLVDQYDLSSIRLLFSGAAPLTAEVQTAVYDRLGQPFIRQGYGMTEGTVAFSSQTDRCNTQGSVGELMLGIEGRVVDPETGKVLAAREEGELQFRGNTMLGYVRNERATADTVDADGWLHTGDVGYYTEQGEWFVVDRLKELIKYKGYQVAPAELEGLLLRMPQIADCGVVGLPDEVAGELPVAFVVRQANQELSEVEVVEFVSKQTSPTKWLRGGVRFVAEIPKNPSGKILRRELRALLKAKKAKL